MKVKLITSLLSIFALLTVANGQDQSEYSQLISEALESYKQRQFELSVMKFEKAFMINSSNQTDLYNAACSAALSGDSAKAFAFLTMSVDNGYSNWAHLEKDCDLYNLHHLPQWDKVISKTKPKSERETLDDLIKCIESKNYEEIWSFCSSELKSKSNKDSVVQMAKKVTELLQLYNLNFSRMRSSVSSSTKRSNSVTTEGYSTEYKVTPQFFGKNTNDLFIKLIGDDLLFELKKERNRWVLDRFAFTDNHFARDFNIKNILYEFFRDTSLLKVRIGITSKDKELVYQSQSQFKNKETKTLYFINSFEKAKYINTYKDFKTLSDTKVFKMYFVKKGTKKKPSLDSFEEFVSSLSEDLQITFVDNSNMVIFSHDKQYAVYYCETSELKKWILREIKVNI